jgi:hypothetical protein
MGVSDIVYFALREESYFSITGISRNKSMVTKTPTPMYVSAKCILGEIVL